MSLLKYWSFSVLGLLFSIQDCSGQPRSQITKKELVGGPCEGCEAIFEYGNKSLSPVDSLPGFLENGPQLKITGTVFQSDGNTPAPDVLIYIYHTNRQGIYASSGNETGWGRRHGQHRGWVRTGPDGRYTFYTFRPAAYPDGREPEHIHLTIKEPDRNEYYLDEYHFADDLLLTGGQLSRLEERGGSGVVLPRLEHGLLTVHRDLYLGKNIPNYE